jgi:hypothetical protein
MSSTQSLTAVVTDIRLIVMRYYPVPEAAQTANPKDFIDIKFLEELDRSGFIDQLYK